MIDEIIRLRRSGLSFRKIAKELDTTVGKVQYQWTKLVNQKTNQSNKASGSRKEHISVTPPADLEISEGLCLNSDDIIHSKLLFNDKVLVSWKLSEQKRNIVSAYFGKPFSAWLQALRIYDVTSMMFDGSNAHSFHEIIVAEEHSDWTIKGINPNRHYLIEFGIKLTENKFFPLLRSNTVYADSVLSYGDVSEQYLQKNNHPPEWTRNVSSYSYYENINEGEE